MARASAAARQAARAIGTWVPKNKHILNGGSKSKARFNTADVAQIRRWVQDALRSPHARFMPNPNVEGTFRVVANVGIEIGVKGQQAIRVIVGFDGAVINAFPVHLK